jgi:hypothetical protein
VFYLDQISSMVVERRSFAARHFSFSFYLSEPLITKVRFARRQHPLRVSFSLSLILSDSGSQERAQLTHSRVDKQKSGRKARKAHRIMYQRRSRVFCFAAYIKLAAIRSTLSEWWKEHFGFYCYSGADDIVGADDASRYKNTIICYSLHQCSAHIQQLSNRETSFAEGTQKAASHAFNALSHTEQTYIARWANV